MSRVEIVPGLLVGHWRVLEQPRLSFNRGYYVARCESRCGVEAPVRVADLLVGRPHTCEACRPGMSPPPASRVRSPGDWSVLMAVELVNPKALDRDTFRNEEWPKAKKMLERMLSTTQYGVNFGWRVYIKAGHKHKKAQKDGLQFLADFPSEKRVHLRTRTAGSAIHWDLYISWVRGDVEVRKVIDTLRLMALGDNGPEVVEDESQADGEFENGLVDPTQFVGGSTSPATPVVAVGHIPNLDDRLMKIQDGLTRAMALNRDMGALAELRADATKREREAAEALATPRAEYERLKVREAQVADEVTALTVQENDLRSRLANFVQEMERKIDTTVQALAGAKATREAVGTDLLAADTVYRPLLAAHEEAVANLRQIEANEKERAAELQRVPNLAALLAAFEKLGQ